MLQDFTGIPAVADLAAMREIVKDKNKDPDKVNPLSPVDLSNRSFSTSRYKWFQRCFTKKC